MSLTVAAFRRLALGLAGAIESAHMGHPDFRANGRIFATLKADGERGMVKLPPDDQARFVREHPSVFAPEAGAWGRQGCTRVELAAADAETVGEALTLAWQTTARSASPRRHRARAPRTRLSRSRKAR